MQILMVLTSHDTLGDTGRKTGFWLEEFAALAHTFLDAGATVTLASPKKVVSRPSTRSAARRRVRPIGRGASGRILAAQATRMANTSRLADVKAGDHDAVFYPGGHGPMWDLAEDPLSIGLIEAPSTVPASPWPRICHGPGVLHRVQFQGLPLVKGKRVTGFTNGEEEAVHLTTVVPFLVEDELKRLGGLYEKAADWASFAVTDGRLVTGQNPGLSPRGEPRALLKLLA